METFRCPTCLFVLTGPEQSRCPSCHKRLRRGGGPIVLGGRKKSAVPEQPKVDLVYAERAELPEVGESTSPRPVPVVEDAPEDLAPVVPLPFMTEAAAVQHTTIFAPSQFDPEMRQVLDDLYRKARAEVDGEYEVDTPHHEADDASA